MNTFEYYNPVRVVFGEDQIQKVSGLIPESATVLLVMGKGSIKSNGVYDGVINALKPRTVVEHWGIEPNPEYENCMTAINTAKEKKVDFLLSVGGGSVLDATKFIAAALHYTGDDPWKILSEGAPVNSAMPIGCVLTLPATGSEVNGNSVISRREYGAKLAFSTPEVMPRFSILDPSVTLSLSPRQTANGIVDAFVHVMEQYLTFDNKAPLQDRQAEAILSTLVEVADALKADPADLDARATLMWCASNALNNLINCGVAQDWSTHVIGHELTALHGLDHARTLAIVLPAMMQYKRDQKGAKIAQFGKRVFNIEGDTTDAVIDATIAKTKSFFDTVGCAPTLKAYDLTVESCLPAAAAIAQRGMKIGEHGDIGQSDIENILALAQ